MSFNIKQSSKTQLHKYFKNYLLDRNEENLQRLYLEYKNLVYAIAFSILKNREDAEDIVQNIFLKLYKLDKKKLPKNNELNWLYTITKNESINLLKNKQKSINYEELNDIPDSRNSFNEIIESDEYNKLMKHLTPLEKEILSFKIIYGFSFKEISATLNLPLGAVEWKYYKSINHIRILFVTNNNKLYIDFEKS